MSLLEPADYYADRDVEHSAQGDIHLDVPFFVGTVANGEEPPRGARKRPEVAIRPPLAAPGILCSYTCGFTAQPPGTPGYSHAFRLVAPIMGLTALKALGVKTGELRKLKELGFLQGLMYLPATEAMRLDEPAEDEEFAGDAAALLYRPALVTQSLLDGRERAHRLSDAAQRILIVALIQSVSPNRFDPFDEDLRPPDLSDSWNP
jgi:hypothetical protein